ncbi:MAG: hypothetical protein IJX28_02430 [Clostridia bacterium]|nr:hypothetical protein [Clostridia bacterium]
MAKENYVVVEKKNTLWKILGIVAAVAAICLVVGKMYQLFLRKKETALEATDDELEMLDELAEEQEALEATEDADLQA